MANRENIQKWVDALRSGEYEQTTGTLERAGKYCCLGVACRVAIENEVPLEYRVESSEDLGIYDDAEGVLPPKVIEWLGIDDESPLLVVNHLASADAAYATALNDSYRWSFNEIADAIEATYLTKENAQ